MLAFSVAFLLILALFVPVLIVSGFCRRDRFLFVTARLFFRTMLKILGIRVRVGGLEGIDFSQPMVLVCNHLSNLDGPLLFSFLPCRPRVLIKSETRRLPLIGSLLRVADFVFVDRKNPQRRQEALVEAVEKIKNKRYSFLVFPEGTRSRDGRPLDFKKGGFMIALKAGVPVLPIRISGSHQLLPPGRVAIGSGTVDIELFSPRLLSGIADSEVAGFVRDLQHKIYQDGSHENTRCR